LQAMDRRGVVGHACSLEDPAPALAFQYLRERLLAQ